MMAMAQVFAWASRPLRDSPVMTRFQAPPCTPFVKRPKGAEHQRMTIWILTLYSCFIICTKYNFLCQDRHPSCALQAYSGSQNNCFVWMQAGLPPTHSLPQTRGGGQARSLYATPPPPPRGLRYSGVGAMTPMAPKGFVHASLSSNHPCFERQISKMRHYINVVCCEVKIMHSELFPGSRGTFQRPLSRSPSIFSFNPQL